jgi:hypothetical protein
MNCIFYQQTHENFYFCCSHNHFLRSYKNLYFYDSHDHFLHKVYNLVLMTKIIARKTIDKKYILVSGCERPSWWNNSFEIMLLVLVRRVRFLLVIISFPSTAFIIDGVFENIIIAFIIFFIFLF